MLKDMLPLGLKAALFGTNCTDTYACPNSNKIVQQYLANIQNKPIAEVQIELHDPSQHKNESTYPNNPTQKAYREACTHGELHISTQTGHAEFGLAK